MKGYVYKDNCIGYKLCPGTCPDIFQMEDDGKAAGKDIEILHEILLQAQEAEGSCPVNVIIIE